MITCKASYGAKAKVYPMRTVRCKCLCGGEFETNSPSLRYLAGHAPSSKARERQKTAKLARKARALRGDNWTPAPKVWPSVEDVLANKPERCEKCAGAMAMDVVQDTGDSGLLPLVALIEWYCINCSKRVPGCDLREHRLEKNALDSVGQCTV